MSRYAEPEARQISIEGLYDHVLVVPVYAERKEQVEKLWSELQGNFLVIVVINCPDTGPDQSTELLASKLTETIAPKLLIVDRFSDGKRIPHRQGVGLARKIGCDLALALIKQGKIRSDWIFTSDADAVLPADYFNLPMSLTRNHSAVVFPFRHTAEPELALACQSYELSMLYYAAGLIWAGSAYGYTSIGSTLAFSANHYAEVRGFPKRNTGEDFYLLNKLRKTAPVYNLPEPLISIEGRLSDRVPIGTGRSIQRIAEAGDQLQVEHPKCYRRLKETLDWIQELSESQPENPSSGIPEIDAALTENGFFDVYKKKWPEKPDRAVMHKHLTDWFDALKTRQFVHRMRDNFYGRMSVNELGAAPFLPDSNSLDTLADACRMQVFRA